MNKAAKSKAKTKSNATSTKRARAHFEIVPMELVFRTKPRDCTFMSGAVRDILAELFFFGYVLGDGHSVQIDEDRRHVRARALFLGKESWLAARTRLEVRQAESVYNVSVSVESGMRALESASVVVKPRDMIPVCKCGRNAEPPLDLWCTPSSKAPPLLCSKGGVIEFWKLPLSRWSFIELGRWNEIVQPLAQLALNPDPDNRMNGPCPIRAQAKAWLSDPSGWFASYSKALATQVQEEIGRPVRVSMPPYHPFRL